MRLTKTAIRELLGRHGIEPSRAFGQNFMVDANTVDRIVRLAEVGPDDNVVEIGPGVGALTLALAETGAHVLAVEADRYLLAPLAEVTADVDVTVIHDDATKLEWLEALSGETNWKLVANLPYNVATSLILDLLERANQIRHFTFLVQREVADRFVAKPGTRQFGLPTLHATYWGHASLVAKVPPTVFYPQPNVDSALVKLTRHDRAPVDADFDQIMSLARTAFAQKRKMLRRSLGGIVDEAEFVRARVESDRRPETLVLEDWSRLAIELSHR